MSDTTKTFDPADPGASTVPDLIEWAKTASDEDKATALAAEQGDGGKNRAGAVLALSPTADPGEDDDEDAGPAEGEPHEKRTADLSGLEEGQPAKRDVYLIHTMAADGSRFLSNDLRPGERANHVVMEGQPIQRGVLEQLKAVQPDKG